MSSRSTAPVVFALGMLILSNDAGAIIYDTHTSKVHLEALEDHHLCVKRDRSGDFCFAALKEWVEKHPDDALEAAQMARRTLAPWTSLHFFKRALKAKQGVCKDKELRAAIEWSATQPLNKAASKQFDALAFEACFENVKDVLVKSAANDHGRTNVCQRLLEKNALNGIRKKKCERWMADQARASQ
ncbi:MAG: hypothetical protein AAFP04_09550 [Myxococcota bacterium]